MAMTDAELILKMRSMVATAKIGDSWDVDVEEMVDTMDAAADRMEALVHDFADHIVTTGRSFRR
jgi:hypothetical protein